jgi:ATP synthase protein I
MIPFERLIRFTSIASFILLFISVILWYLLPIYRPYTGGFILGTGFSMLNGVITAVKTVQISEYALGLRKKKQGTGRLQRFLLAGFAGYVAIRYPSMFHYVGVVAGLMTVTVLSLLVSLFYHLSKNKDTAERGEK